MGLPQKCLFFIKNLMNDKLSADSITKDMNENLVSFFTCS